VARFPFLAKPPHCFPEPHRQRSKRLETPLSPLRQFPIISAAHFGQ